MHAAAAAAPHGFIMTHLGITPLLIATFSCCAPAWQKNCSAATRCDHLAAAAAAIPTQQLVIVMPLLPFYTKYPPWLDPVHDLLPPMAALAMQDWSQLSCSWVSSESCKDRFCCCCWPGCSACTCHAAAAATSAAASFLLNCSCSPLRLFLLLLLLLPFLLYCCL